METSTVTLTYAPGDPHDLSELKSHLTKILGSENVHTTATQAFGGWNEVIVVLSIGGGVAIKEVASVIRAWIERNKGKKANLSKMEFTGYSAKELKELTNPTDTSRAK
ncbi:MAG: hypothetical protein O9331_20160 [Acidovorax sp.]|nr:hypothetical protein [Acidovorax sp.]